MDKPVEYLSSTIDTVTGTLDENMGWLNDNTLTNVIVLGLIIYAAFFVGKIWPNGLSLFKNPFVKVISFILIAFIATKNIALATVATIALITIMMTNLKNTKEFLTVIPSEKLTTDDEVYEAIMGRCICRCNGTQCDCDCKNDNNNDNNKKRMVQEEIVIEETLPEEIPVEMIEEEQIQQEDQEEQEIRHEEIEKQYPNEYQQLNTLTLKKIMNQLSEHEKEIMKNRTISTNCNKSSYYRGNRTPFITWPYFNKNLPLTTLDASYSPVGFV